MLGGTYVPYLSKVAINANNSVLRGVMREEFESWLLKNFPELFHKGSPLIRNKDGVYVDRGTLGMWIVWRHKTEEMNGFKVQVKQLLVEKGVYEY